MVGLESLLPLEAGFLVYIPIRNPYAVARFDRRGITNAKELAGVVIVVKPKTSRILGRKKQGGVGYSFLISTGTVHKGLVKGWAGKALINFGQNRQ